YFQSPAAESVLGRDNDDEKKSYKELLVLMKRHIARVREDRNIAARDKFATDYTNLGKPTTPAPKPAAPTPTPKDGKTGKPSAPAPKGKPGAPVLPSGTPKSHGKGKGKGGRRSRSPSTKDTSKTFCHFHFNKGNCKHGDKCQYSHSQYHWDKRKDKGGKGKNGRSATPRRSQTPGGKKDRNCYGWLKGDCQKGDKCTFKHDPSMKGKRAAPSTKTSDAKATPALVREYDDDFIVNAVPSEKKNKMDVKFNYHVEIHEHVKPDFVECSNRKPRRNLSRAQKRSLTCRTTKEIMDDQQWMLQSKLGMTRARAIGILMDDYDEFSDVDEVHVILGPKNAIKLKINTNEYLENNPRAAICYEAELVMKVLGLMGNNTASRKWTTNWAKRKATESKLLMGLLCLLLTVSLRMTDLNMGKRGDGIIYLSDNGEHVKLDKRGRPYRVGPDGRKEVRGSPRPKSSYSPEEWRSLSAKERDVIIRRGKLEEEADKLKEIKLKKEKEKKAKAEAAAKKKKSEASSHKDPPKDEGRKKKKKSNKDSKESSGKDGSKDAAVGVGKLRGDWERIPTPHDPMTTLNHNRGHSTRECLSTIRGASDLINIKKRNTASPEMPPQQQGLRLLRWTVHGRITVEQEKDELAGKFRYGKTILITDLVYKCNSNARGTTNIQYGLDEMGYAATVIDINSFRSVTRAQKFLDAVEHLKRNVMPDIASEDVAIDSADILRSYGIMVTTDDGMWRLMYGPAGNHYMNNHNMPDRLGVFDYLKMVLGNDFTDVMGYLDVAAEKCGDVVEMWLGMLDLANMTKSQITFMETKADPGELLAGLEGKQRPETRKQVPK
ncbi:unnamed protein product, partial [Cladocopium goreaui]